MLKTLVKKQLMDIFRSYFYDAKKNKKRSALSTAMFIVLFALIMVVLLGGIFTALSLMLCAPMHTAGMDWFYFSIMGLLSIFLGAFGSVFNTYSGLYLSKDNDLLLSMPIPVKIIMLSRLLSVYLLGLMYSAVIFVPAMIVYWIKANAPAAAVISSIVMLLLISVFVLVLSCALGWVVAKISLKLKNKSIITVIISLAFFGIYYFACFRASSILQSMLENMSAIGNEIMANAYPLVVFGRGAAGDWASLIIVAAVVLALFAITWYALAHSFIKIATSTGKSEKVKYREKKAVMRSPSAALLGKELSRFTSSPNYMLNCGLGLIIMPIVSVLALIKGGSISSLLLQIFGSSDFSAVLAIAAVCAIAAMDDMAAPSVSLEGKNIWLAQSLPIAPWSVLRAKLSMHFLLTGSVTLLCSVCIAIALRMPLIVALLSVLIPLAYILFTAGFGMLLDLKRPNLTWTNETAPIKQSLPVTIVLFGGWIYSLIVLAMYYFIKDKVSVELYLAIVLAATLIADFALLGWLKKRGSRIFSEL